MPEQFDQREDLARMYLEIAEAVYNRCALDDGTQALLAVGIAQAGVMFAVLDKLNEGTLIGGLEELKDAMNALARKLPDR